MGLEMWEASVLLHHCVPQIICYRYTADHSVDFLNDTLLSYVFNFMQFKFEFFFIITGYYEMILSY